MNLTQPRVFLFATILLFFSSTTVAETVQGIVYLDADADGVRDPGESGIAEVRVSNGLDVVLTDDDGRYELTVEGDTVLFVVKPAGYSVPVDSANIPQFYYVHRPQGSPTHFRYRGIDPTGPLPESVDFPLIASEKEEVFDAILFADPQPQSEAELDYIRDDVVSELVNTTAKFGMTMGDIMFDDLALFDRYNHIIAQIGVPWFNVPGNHELNFDAESDDQSLETFTRFFGPSYYSFEYGNVVFIVLDNVIYEGATEVTVDNPSGRGRYVGEISSRQIEWLANELEHVPTDKLVFLAMHIPLMSHSGPVGNIHTKNSSALLGMLDEYPHVYTVAGHMHSTEHVYLDSNGQVAEDGRFHHHVLTTVSGSWWSGPFDERGIPVSIQSDGSPNGYHVLTVSDVTPSVRFKAASQPADHQMRIVFDRAFHSDNANGLRDFHPGELFEGRMTSAQTESTKLYVNVFDGGPKTVVKFRIDDGEFTDMMRTAERDPTFLSIINRHTDSVKSWLTPFPSQHLWVARLPRLSGGTYTIEVHVVDEFGRFHLGHRILEVTQY